MVTDNINKTLSNIEKALDFIKNNPNPNYIKFQVCNTEKKVGDNFIIKHFANKNNSYNSEAKIVYVNENFLVALPV